VLLKDTVVRSRKLLGQSAVLQVGWDCHGLPLEQRALKEGATPTTLRVSCAALAKDFSDKQRATLQRLGVATDYTQAYYTASPSYEHDELQLWAAFQEKNLTYRALKPVYWSTGYQTALAEAEVEHKDVGGTSAYVSFEVTLTSGVSTRVLVWTTQPWTLLSNKALAFNPKLTYVYATDANQETWVVAEDRCLALNLTPEQKVDLTNATYKHPLTQTVGKVLQAGFVTADSGTGVVHLAPGHGPEDYQACLGHNVETFSPVDGRGCFTAEVCLNNCVGVYVFKANPLVLEALGKALVRTEDYVHSYPHCWRSKTPVLFRAVHQWFVNLSTVKSEVLNALSSVTKYPVSQRLEKTLETRPDWCVSRQRVWGLPMPVFYTPEGEPVSSPDLTRKVAELFKTHGSQYWFDHTSEELCDLLQLPTNLTKGTDTFDVWMDSGTSAHHCLKDRAADLYLEGADQHRGWFQSSALAHYALYGKLPYKALYTHGFVLQDAKTKEKLAKSGGAKAVDHFVSLYGADTLRLWALSQDSTCDVVFTEDHLKQQAETVRLVRNTLRVVLANGVNEAALTHNAPLSAWGKAYLGQLALLQSNFKRDTVNFQLHRLVPHLQLFCKDTLSSNYLDSVKDTLYCDFLSTPSRLEAVHLLTLTYVTLLELTDTVLPFTTAEVKSHSPWATQSVKLTAPSPEEMNYWTDMLKLKASVNQATEVLRNEKLVGKNSETQVSLPVLPVSLQLTPLNEVAEVLGTSLLTCGHVEKLTVTKHTGVKCPRCWKWVEPTSVNTAGLCTRCTTVTS